MNAVNLESWIEANTPATPEGHRLRYSMVTPDGDGVVFIYVNIKHSWGNDIKIVVKSPELIVELPLPDWVEGHDSSTGCEFISIASRQIREWADAQLADLAQRNGAAAAAVREGNGGA